MKCEYTCSPTWNLAITMWALTGPLSSLRLSILDCKVGGHYHLHLPTGVTIRCTLHVEAFCIY